MARIVFKKGLAGLILLAVAFLASATHAQTRNILSNKLPGFSNCGEDVSRGFLHKHLTDGITDTLWRNGYAIGACELIFRFEELQTINVLELVDTYQPTKFLDTSPLSRITIWASHQSFGDSFFKLDRIEFKPEDTMQIAFAVPIKLRSLKFTFERVGATGYDARIAELRAFGPEKHGGEVRWPQKPMQPFAAHGDPLTQDTATLCDELAGHPFNPDSYGCSRLDTEVDVVAAARACNQALAGNPDSPRLNLNMARIDLLAERSERALGRLTASVLADYPPAHYLLGVSLENGFGVEANKERAEEFYRKSADAGFGPALLWIAASKAKERRLKIASGAIVADADQVIPELRQAVDLEFVPAYPAYFQHVMAHKQMPAAAAYDLAESAAEYGYYADEGAYSTNLFNGYKIGRRAADARRYLYRDAKLNRSSLMTNYVFDNANAFRPGYWRRRGAYSGDYWSLERFTLQQASQELRAYLTKATFERAKADAENGNDWATEWVAQYYDKGFGVEKDPKEALRWRCKAIRMGNPVALSRSVSCEGVAQ